MSLIYHKNNHPKKPQFTGVYDVLKIACGYIGVEERIHLIPIERYEEILEDDIIVWNFEPIIKEFKNRHNKLIKALYDSNVKKIYSFDLAQTIKYNHPKLRYLPLGYVEEMVNINTNQNRSGKTILMGSKKTHRKLLLGEKIYYHEPKNYVSYKHTSELLSEFSFGLDFPIRTEYHGLYINCLRISQYIMNGINIATSEDLTKFGIRKSAYLDIFNKKTIQYDNFIAEQALEDLKNNVNMREIYENIVFLP